MQVQDQLIHILQDVIFFLIYLLRKKKDTINTLERERLRARSVCSFNLSICFVSLNRSNSTLPLLQSRIDKTGIPLWRAAALAPVYSIV